MQLGNKDAGPPSNIGITSSKRKVTETTTQQKLETNIEMHERNISFSWDLSWDVLFSCPSSACFEGWRVLGPEKLRKKKVLAVCFLEKKWGSRHLELLNSCPLHLSNTCWNMMAKHFFPNWNGLECVIKRNETTWKNHKITIKQKLQYHTPPNKQLHF